MAVKKEAVFFLFLVAATEINGRDDFQYLEATIDSIQAAFAEEKLTSRELVEFYLRQIEELNPTLRAVVEVDPTALDQAGESDRRRREGRRRSEWIEGVPVMLKDTMATREGTNTTAGSFAMVGSVAARDAGVVAKLRAAGAVILGKSSLTEWYSFRDMGRIPNAWCARSGQGMNPYVPKGDPCGSNSGSAISVAANMVAVSLGSDTHGSILCPSDHNSAVGLRPTVGLTSRSAVIPVYPPHDTVGPITRSVSDAVYVLDAIVGFDENDEEVTKEAAKFIPMGGYIQFLKLNGLRRKRLGVVRKPFVDSFIGSSVFQAFEDHLNMLRRNGATIVDDLEIENVETVMNPSKSGEHAAMLSGFKLSLNNYLKELVISPVRSLADIIAFNENHADLEKTKEYGQHTFIESEKTSGIGEKEREAIERMRNLSRDGFEKLMSENKLDALITPGIGCISVLAIGGYPGITVPAGYEEETGMPFGLCFGGLKGSEPKLIEAAYAFERATLIRRPPLLELVQVE